MRSDRPRYKYYEMHENLEKMFRSPALFELPHALKPSATATHPNIPLLCSCYCRVNLPATN